MDRKAIVEKLRDKGYKTLEIGLMMNYVEKYLDGMKKELYLDPLDSVVKGYVELQKEAHENRLKARQLVLEKGYPEWVADCFEEFITTQSRQWKDLKESFDIFEGFYLEETF